ncbi:hypothetical protein, partial [Serratia marcescens]|uniref:hypothetical protein n=1 Tax=Serratia marcescens TaxID=615 RepID=UPI002813C734
KLLQEKQKPARCKSGLIFSKGLSVESSGMLNSARYKKKFVSFVNKGSDAETSDQHEPSINKIAYVKPVDRR